MGVPVTKFHNWKGLARTMLQGQLVLMEPWAHLDLQQRQSTTCPSKARRPLCAHALQKQLELRACTWLASPCSNHGPCHVLLTPVPHPSGKRLSCTTRRIPAWVVCNQHWSADNNMVTVMSVAPHFLLTGHECAKVYARPGFVALLLPQGRQLAAQLLRTALSIATDGGPCSSMLHQVQVLRLIHLRVLPAQRVASTACCQHQVAA